MNTRQVLCTIGFALATSAGDVRGQEFWDGNKLLEHMQSADIDSRMAALGYVMGAMDMGQSVSFCMPSSITAGQARDMIKQHLENAPSTRHFLASTHITYVMRRAWPCANSTPKPPASRMM